MSSVKQVSATVVVDRASIRSWYRTVEVPIMPARAMSFFVPRAHQIAANLLCAAIISAPLAIAAQSSSTAPQSAASPSKMPAWVRSEDSRASTARTLEAANIRAGAAKPAIASTLSHLSAVTSLAALPIAHF